MKKTILLILAVLPIVLVIIIAFAGRIFSMYQHIPVERVEFIDENGDAFTDQTYFVVNMGDSQSTAIKIYPELASNKKVTYTSNDESICTVDKQGVVTGVHYGSTSVLVKTDDGGLVAKLNVIVTADYPVGVTIVTKGDANKPSIPMDDPLTLLVGEQYNLDVVVELDAALDKYKSVIYSSDNPDVLTIDVTGKMIAVSEGTATVTVTTEYGGYTDTLVVNVEQGELPLYFDFTGVEGVSLRGDVYALSKPSIDLIGNLLIRDDINPDDVVIEIYSGSSIATITDGTLNFSSVGLVGIRAYVGDKNSPTYVIEVSIGYAP